MALLCVRTARNSDVFYRLAWVAAIPALGSWGFGACFGHARIVSQWKRRFEAETARTSDPSPGTIERGRVRPIINPFNEGKWRMSPGNGTMPHEVEETYNHLSDQLVLRHCRWTIYRQLFGAGPERIDLLNRFGGIAFGMIQRIMEDETVMALCRMSDPAVSGRGRNARDNCTFARLVSLVTNGATTKAELERKVALESLLASIDHVRGACMEELRNRVLAHLDLTTFNNMATGRPGPTRPNRANVELFLAAARNLMNAGQKCYEDAETHYGEFNLPPGKDGEVLLLHLTDLARRHDAEGDPDSNGPPRCH